MATAWSSLACPAAKIQAFNAKTLESLWVYTDELGGQPNCPITYKDGYIYAGFWNSEDRNANFACINTIDEDHASATEVKYASWTYTRAGGFYWAGAYVTDKLAIVGTDDGAGGYDTNGAALLVFDRFTGEKLDAHEGIRGDLRSNVSHDPESDRVFFTTKGGILGNAQIDWDTGKILDYKEVVIKDAQGNANAMSTCTPSVYNGRIYIGVAGTSQFGANSGHGIAVYNLNGDGSHDPGVCLRHCWLSPDLCHGLHGILCRGWLRVHLPALQLYPRRRFRTEG